MKIVDIKKYNSKETKNSPIFLSSVQAGFPSPADDFAEKELNLHDLIVSCPAATFFVRVEGDSMKDANIFSGDILVVDRSKSALTGKVVVAIVNGEFTVKRLEKRADGIYLCPENPAFSPIKVNEASDAQVWGVVTYVIHKS